MVAALAMVGLIGLFPADQPMPGWYECREGLANYEVMIFETERQGVYTTTWHMNGRVRYAGVLRYNPEGYYKETYVPFSDLGWQSAGVFHWVYRDGAFRAFDLRMTRAKEQ